MRTTTESEGFYMMAGGVRRTTEGEGEGGRRDRARDAGERTAARPARSSGMPTEPVTSAVSLAERGRLGGGPFLPSLTSLVRGLVWGEKEGVGGGGWTDRLTNRGQGRAKGRLRMSGESGKGAAAAGCCHGEV